MTSFVVYRIRYSDTCDYITTCDFIHFIWDGVSLTLPSDSRYYELPSHHHKMEFELRECQRRWFNQMQRHIDILLLLKQIVIHDVAMIIMNDCYQLIIRSFLHYNYKSELINIKKSSASKFSELIIVK